MGETIENGGRPPGVRRESGMTFAREKKVKQRREVAKALAGRVQAGSSGSNARRLHQSSEHH
jgi:hypothetical protein